METNPQLELAFRFLADTAVSIFLTGKAGTGKTTFLQELKRRSPKRMIVVAPTGVAAIHAGGVTIHSFFQLPFGPYLPVDPLSSVEEKRYKHRFGREKIDLIRTLDLLVIDEVSMVRADLLDAVSDMLARYRGQAKPFGGVQLLMIGDLQQLAPVVKEEEWEILKQTYESPFFFSSKALQRMPYQCIELQQVYRQKDAVFVGLLNRIRENRADPVTLKALNSRYIPGFDPDDSEGYITLTTHNYQAQRINRQKLAALDGRTYVYAAEIKDDFPDYAYPTEAQLVLKKGAQVMFVKNDSSSEKRYYNGKIGHITAISAENIMVRCGSESEAISVSQEEWTNIQYKLDPETQEIKETVVGSFKQYPLKTAWAITVHKSQGLTFEKAIVNVGAAFTHGQVYVALSRCKSLEGLVLGTPLRSGVLICDPWVRQYIEEVARHQPGKEQLMEARRLYYGQLLKELFDYGSIFRRLQYVAWVFGEHLWRFYPELTRQCREVREFCRTELLEVGERFQRQLERMMGERYDYENDVQLQERIIKGGIYFQSRTEQKVVDFLEKARPEVDNKEVRKTVEEALEKLNREVKLKLAVLETVKDGFCIHTYLSAKTRAILDRSKRSSKKIPEKLVVGEDILHPELYQALRSWRKEVAMRLKLPVYVVLKQKALLAVANTLPTSHKELLALPGIGKKVIELYGGQLLELVDRYRWKISGNRV